MSDTPDLWHVGELPGDAGLVLRDENGLTAMRCGSRSRARQRMRVHNAAELRRVGRREKWEWGGPH
jgi:hypothetical protein